jgi:hypothetical protein
LLACTRVGLSFPDQVVKYWFYARAISFWQSCNRISHECNGDHLFRLSHFCNHCLNLLKLLRFISCSCEVSNLRIIMISDVIMTYRVVSASSSPNSGEGRPSLGLGTRMWLAYLSFSYPERTRRDEGLWPNPYPNWHLIG